MIRQSFEKWALTKDLKIIRIGEDYQHKDTQLTWEAWKARSETEDLRFFEQCVASCAQGYLSNPRMVKGTYYDNCSNTILRAARNIYEKYRKECHG